MRTVCSSISGFTGTCRAVNAVMTGTIYTWVQLTVYKDKKKSTIKGIPSNISICYIADTQCYKQFNLDIDYGRSDNETYIPSINGK